MKRRRRPISQLAVMHGGRRRDRVDAVPTWRQGLCPNCQHAITSHAAEGCAVFIGAIGGPEGAMCPCRTPGPGR